MTASKPQQRLFPLAPAAPQRGDNATTFVNNMRLPVHRWFRYSAGYSAEWVDAELHARRDSVERVLDPFSGSGTTLLAAQHSGVESIGIESHDFVSRVAQAKLCWTADPTELRAAAHAVVDAALPDPDPDPPALMAKCFDSHSLAVLRGLWRAIDDADVGEPVARLLWLGLVAILRPCSHVGTAQWQYVLPNKSKSKVAEPVGAFEGVTSLIAEDMELWQSELPAPPSAVCVESDARTCEAVPDAWADLVLTSPPYANNYDYADATRLEMTFLGEVTSWGDLKRVREPLMRSCSQHMSGFDAEEALASPEVAPILGELLPVFERLAEERESHGGRKAYHHMVAAYFLDLAQVWNSLRRVTAPDAEVCFVVGDSAPYGVYVPVERWLGELAIAAGFSEWHFDKQRDRNMKWKNRKHRVPLHEGRLWVR